MFDVRHFPSKDRQFLSVGYLCQLLVVTPGQLIVLMEATGVEVTAMVDGIAYFDGDATQVLVNKLNQLRKEIADAAEAASRAGDN